MIFNFLTEVPFNLKKNIPDSKSNKNKKRKQFFEAYGICKICVLTILQYEGLIV
jgi:hypothetical protein